MALIDVCVVYILRTRDEVPEVLLGYKRTGLGLGRVVGIGGKVEAGETVPQAAVREIQEETGLTVSAADLDPVGVLDYHFPSRPDYSQRSHVFVCRRFAGEPVETEEIVPAWFAVGDVPYERMWDDAGRWLPEVLRGGSITATGYTFGDDLATVVGENPPPIGV
ncbi:MAG: 8-oxo-dGTP diphosphatase [Microbacterium sp.]|uniref:8-oxo-dGTP diphosphatase n=1 Tax=Microbacterium sp. TaxID=51671 RepID=UPI00260EE26D|nr:8-oxo-dGTP diphosphatase [Microbacterium sp.]MCX6503188.1 8-oxo-dGTP diphosphatase [Microbacterium sp.]